MACPLPCGCKKTCLDCMSHWVPSKITSIRSKIPCPVETCKKEFTLQEIISALPEAEKAKINEFLLKFSLNIKSNNNPQKYLNHGDHILSGFFKKSSSKLRNCKNELFTYLWKAFKTRKCPSCQVQIVRDEDDYGCSSMECTHCKCKFCWHCLKDECQRSHGYDSMSGEIGSIDVTFEMVFLIVLGLGLGLGALWGLKIIGSWIVSVLA